MFSPKQTKPIRSVAVIGAGFSGLVSSLLLSREGREVILIERDARVAPLLRNCTYDGFEVNNAFQYLGGYYPGSALHACFEKLGLNEHLAPIPINDSGPDRFLGVVEGELVIPVGLLEVKSVLEDVFPKNESVLSEYFGLMAGIFRDFSFFNLKNFFAKTAAGLGGVSLKEFLSTRKAGKDLIEFLSIYSEMLLGVTADEVPLLTHLLGVGAYFLSAHTFQGGGGALVAALEKKVREGGIRILTDSEVVGLECDSHRKYSGLTFRSGRNRKEMTLNTDACISTVHPHRLLQLLPEGSPWELYSRRILNYRNTKSICLFHLVLDPGTLSGFNQNCHLVHRAENGSLEHLLAVLPNFINHGETAKKGDGLSVLVKAWENDSNKGCPGRKEAGVSSKPAKLLDAECRQLKPEFLDGIRYNMISKFEDFFPDLSGKYRIVKALSPCDFDRINRSWHGSIYGVKCSVDRYDFTTSGPLKRLFLSGQSVFAPGIYGALTSSYLAVERLMR